VEQRENGRRTHKEGYGMNGKAWVARPLEGERVQNPLQRKEGSGAGQVEGRIRSHEEAEPQK